MSKKEIEISGMELNVPKKYQPYWMQIGAVPFEVDVDRINKEDIRQKINEPRQQFKATVIESDEEIPQIKMAQHMEPEEASAWYDEVDPKIPLDKMIDNNDVVDIGALQRHKIISDLQSPNTINDVRERLKKDVEPEPEEARIAQPGEFVVLLRNKLTFIGNLAAAKAAAEKIILDNEDLGDDELIIFLRVPLNKIFRD